MAFVAAKPCRFSGQSFRIGESVPDEVIHPGAIRNLLKMGLIAEAGALATKPAEAGKTTQTITITIHDKKGDLILAPTPEGLQAIFDVLSSSIAGAEPTISKMTDGDALILLDATDNRKSIKELCKTRAQEIAEPTNEESEGDL